MEPTAGVEPAALRYPETGTFVKVSRSIRLSYAGLYWYYLQVAVRREQTRHDNKIEIRDERDRA